MLSVRETKTPPGLPRRRFDVPQLLMPNYGVIVAVRVTPVTSSVNDVPFVQA